MARLALPILALLSMTASAGAEPEARLLARVASTIDGQRTPSLWLELRVEGPAEDARRTCEALLALETRALEVEGRVLRARVERACAEAALPRTPRSGTWLRQQDGLPLLELLVAGIDTHSRGEVTTWSRMAGRAECELARYNLELRAQEDAAAAQESARSFLADEHAAASAEAERACAQAKSARRRLPRKKSARFAYLLEVARLERGCETARALAEVVGKRAAREEAAPEQPARPAPMCVRGE